VWTLAGVFGRSRTPRDIADILGYPQLGTRDSNPDSSGPKPDALPFWLVPTGPVRRRLGIVIVLWIALAVVAGVIVILAAATGLSLAIGATLAHIQGRRQRPTFRERRRIGRGRST
jgi:hypothetical protein